MGMLFPLLKAAGMHGNSIVAREFCLHYLLPDKQDSNIGMLNSVFFIFDNRFVIIVSYQYRFVCRVLMSSASRCHSTHSTVMSGSMLDRRPLQTNNHHDRVVGEGRCVAP